MRHFVNPHDVEATAAGDEAVALQLLLEVRSLREQFTQLQHELSRTSPPSNRTWQTNGESGTHASGSRFALHATFFGRFAVYRADQRLTLGNRRVVVELAQHLIAHAGSPVVRDQLIETLWPDNDSMRTTHRLHVAISELRRYLDDPTADRSIVVLEDEAYSIASNNVTTDYDVFEKHYQRGKSFLARHDDDAAAAEFRAALVLYAGEYLAEYPYLDWALQRRAHFADRQLRVLTLLCEHSAARGDLGATEEYAQSVLDIDNSRERAHRHLMRSHYLMGQRATAIRQFRACTEYLRRELGAEPSMLTRRVYDAICSDTPIPAETPICG